MRNIRFRGKRIDNGEWTCGSLLSFDNGMMSIAPTKSKVFKASNEVMTLQNIFDVDPATVGQFTGLKDKNGKEIYEGDILRARLFNYVVKWNKELATWYCDPIPKEHVITTTKTLFEAAEIGVVIGNIHDNPGLLEVKA